MIHKGKKQCESNKEAPDIFQLYQSAIQYSSEKQRILGEKSQLTAVNKNNLPLNYIKSKLYGIILQQTENVKKFN